MTVTLKFPKTGTFLTGFGGETEDITAALHFENGVQAQEHCREHKCEDFEIYYHFDDARLDFSVKVGGLDVV